MLRVIAHAPSFTGIEQQACCAVGRARLLPRARIQDTAAVFHPARPGAGRASVATKGIEHEGDFGGRDPTAGEIATGFGSKSYGHADTDHVLRPPPGMAQFVGLKAKKCQPCEGGNVPRLPPDEVERLRTQVGWRLVTTADGKEAIRHDWKVRNFKAAIDMCSRIAEVAEAEGHHPDLHLVNYSNLGVELTTHSAGGLTENDFIMAAKVNDIDLADLLPKRKARYWA